MAARWINTTQDKGEKNIFPHQNGKLEKSMPQNAKKHDGVYAPMSPKRIIVGLILGLEREATSS